MALIAKIVLFIGALLGGSAFVCICGYISGYNDGQEAGRREL